MSEEVDVIDAVGEHELQMEQVLRDCCGKRSH